MEDIEQLKLEVKSLSFAVRLGLSVVIIAFAVQCCITLARAHHFKEIFDDLLAADPLPYLTTIFLTFSGRIMAAVILLALAGVAGLFVFPRKIWNIPTGVLIAIVTVAVTQLAIFSFQMPMLRIISNLTDGI